MPIDCWSPKSLLNRCKVVGRHNPAEPAATIFCALLHRLAKGRLIYCRVIKSRDNFDVRAITNWQHKVSRAKARVASAIVEARMQRRAKALHGVSKLSIGYRVRDVIEAHVPNLGAPGELAPNRGCLKQATVRGTAAPVSFFARSARTALGPAGRTDVFR